MNLELDRILIGIVNTILWSAVSIAIVVLVIEILNRRYHLLQEIFGENNTAAALLAAAFVLGIFYTVVQIVIH
jgi:hypothetical protein